MHTPRVDLIAIVPDHTASSVPSSQPDPLDDPLNAPLDAASIREKPLSQFSVVTGNQTMQGPWKLFRRVWRSQGNSSFSMSSSAKVVSVTMNHDDP